MPAIPRGELPVETRYGSYGQLRVRVRWNIAVALCLFFIVTMLVLAVLNRRSGYPAVVTLDLAVAAVLAVGMALLFGLKKEVGGRIFFAMAALLIAAVPVESWAQGRDFHYWYYLMPVCAVFLLPTWQTVAVSTLFGIAAMAMSRQNMVPLDLARFGLSYFVLVGFVATYSFLEDHAGRMLRFYSEHDPLTNCRNRRTFNEWMEGLEQSGEMPEPCALLLIDVDHFKAVNDEHGHLVGDRAITQIALVLSETLGDDAPLYRFGGEEFAVILRACREAEATALAERLREAVAARPFGETRLTISIGVAIVQPGRGRIRDILEAADVALYRAKNGGRNRVVVTSGAGTA